MKTKVAFGIVGKPLTHSFSPMYFAKIFKRQKLNHYHYNVFELKHIQDIKAIWKQRPSLIGLNVTYPYKRSVLDYVTYRHALVQRIGAANVLKRTSSKQWEGYNTDYLGAYARLQRLPNWVWQRKTLVCGGTGAAAKAVLCALEDLGKQVDSISRTNKILSYDSLEQSPELIKNYSLIIQATPLGTGAYINQAPPLPYELLNKSYALFDLVYNPCLLYTSDAADE